ncbi:hypothetical protein LCGC14_1255680 [marine sediment metagenome]|uniref:Uncharacterized protein n=1 Tax=marine sediment metagenome TaxID=412755 RepID=A0A0F9P5K9_9ZZZZ
MNEVDEMKKVIAEQRRQRIEADKQITLAIERVDRTRKEKRDISNRPK